MDVVQASLCYEIAYRLIPHYLHHDRAKLLDFFGRQRAALMLYALAAAGRGVDPDPEVANRFRSGYVPAGDDGTTTFVITYPEPRERFVTLEAFRRDRPSLGPHLSATVFGVDGRSRHFVLHQSFEGATNLRLVDGATNANLGPGSPVDVDAFVELVHARLSEFTAD